MFCNRPHIFSGDRYISKISFRFSTPKSIENFSFTSLATFSATEGPKESDGLNNSTSTIELE